MNDSERLLRKILAEMVEQTALLRKLAGVEKTVKAKPGSVEGSVASVVKQFGRVVMVNDASDGDLPSQLTPEQRKAQRFMDGQDNGRGRPGRRTETARRGAVRESAMTPYDLLVREIDKLYEPDADDTVMAHLVTWCPKDGGPEGPDEDYPECPILMVAQRDGDVLVVHFVYGRASETANIMWRIGAQSRLMARQPLLRFLPLDDPFAVDTIRGREPLTQAVSEWARVTMYKMAENDISTVWRAQEARRFVRAVRDALDGGA